VEDDGKWEDVRDKYTALVGQKDANGNYTNPINSPADMLKLMDRAYNMVDAKVKRYRGNKPEIRRSPVNTKNASSNGQNKKPFTEAKTLGEAIKSGMSELGYEIN
jgi:hypothetical protein